MAQAGSPAQSASVQSAKPSKSLSWPSSQTSRTTGSWVPPILSMSRPQPGRLTAPKSAGSTAASLRAGLPTLVVPHVADQPLWGERVWKLGAGPEPLSKKKLGAESLATRIDEMRVDRTMQQTAARLGAALREEDGTGSALSFINRFVGEL